MLIVSGPIQLLAVQNNTHTLVVRRGPVWSLCEGTWTVTAKMSRQRIKCFIGPVVVDTTSVLCVNKQENPTVSSLTILS